jgi:hypothetical protein
VQFHVGSVHFFVSIAAAQLNVRLRVCINSLISTAAVKAACSAYSLGQQQAVQSSQGKQLPLMK